MTKLEKIALSVALLIGCYYGFLAEQASRARQIATASTAVAQQLSEQNKTFQEQTLKQIQVLQSSNTSLQQQLLLKQKNDSKLSPTDLGSKLETLTQAPEGSVTLEPTGHFDLTATETLAVVQDLEALPVLTQQLANAQSQFTLEQQAHHQDSITAAANLIACNNTLSAVKSDARKSKLKWFAAGVVVGFVGRSAITFAK